MPIIIAHFLAPRAWSDFQIFWNIFRKKHRWFEMHYISTPPAFLIHEAAHLTSRYSQTIGLPYHWSCYRDCRDQLPEFRIYGFVLGNFKLPVHNFHESIGTGGFLNSQTPAPNHILIKDLSEFCWKSAYAPKKELLQIFCHHFCWKSFDIYFLLHIYYFI